MADSIRSVIHHILIINDKPGQESIEEAIRVFRLGALDYFAKDFRSDKMSRIVQEALRKPVVAPV